MEYLLLKKCVGQVYGENHSWECGFDVRHILCNKQHVSVDENLSAFTYVCTDLFRSCQEDCACKNMNFKNSTKNSQLS